MRLSKDSSELARHCSTLYYNITGVAQSNATIYEYRYDYRGVSFLYRYNGSTRLELLKAIL